MISNLLFILVIAFGISIFWKQRRQTELAKNYIEHRCEQHSLQLISVARAEQTYGWPKGPLDIKTRYNFEFSTNGMNCYQGYVLMKGYRVQEMYMPPYPI